MLAVSPLYVDADSGVVDPDGTRWSTAYADLQSALDQAATLNADADPANDITAIWLANGRYTPTKDKHGNSTPDDPRTATFSMLSGVSLHGAFAGDEETLDARPKDPDGIWLHETILSGNPASGSQYYTVVYVAYLSRSLVLDGLTITEGRASSSPSSYNSEWTHGGGIHVESSQVTLRNSTIRGNIANYGGGAIFNRWGTVTIIDSILNDNSAPWGMRDDGGGAILNFASSSMTLINATLSGNSSRGFAGGILNHGTLSVTDSTISGNSASSFNESSGGGIYNGPSGTTEILRSTFEGNYARYGGGGIYCDVQGSVTITDSTFNDNSAGTFGGGIFDLDGSVTVIDSTFTGNSAEHGGGGVYGIDGIVSLTGSTFTDNWSKNRSSAAYIDSGTLTVTGSTFKGNSGSPAMEGADSTVTITDSLVSENTEGGVSNVRGTVTIRNSTISENSNDYGGGIFTRKGKMTIIDSTIHANSSTSGGGIYCVDSRLTVIRSTLSENVTNGNGGAIYSGSPDRNVVIIVSDSIFSGNSATQRGGGIHLASYGKLTLTNSTLTGNSTAKDGGAVFADAHTTITVTGSTFSENVAQYSGGGIYIESAGTLSVANSTFDGNRASGRSGGGIYSSYSNLAITNSTLRGNSAGQDGGGIYTDRGEAMIANSAFVANSARNAGGGVYGYRDIEIINSTICANSAPSGGGIRVDYRPLIIINSILTLNQGGDVRRPDDITAHHSLLGGNPGFARNPSDGGDGWGDDPETAEVDESANDDFGDLRLVPTSPAVNAGDTSALPSVSADLDGNTRVVGAAIDIGAYELQGEPAPGRETPSVVVTSTVDTPDFYDGQITLREAIHYARLDDGLGSTITFDSVLADATIALGGLALWIDRSLTIDASALSSLTVDGQGKSRVFGITGGETDEVQLIGLTITGGKGFNGGGISNQSIGNVVVAHSVVSGNSTRDGGGAIYNHSGALTLTDSTLHGNSTDVYGGAIQNHSGMLTVVNSTLTENSARSGGAIFNRRSGTLTVMNSTVAENSVSGSGGGIYNDSSATLVAVNLSVHGNSADNGGGIFSRGSATLDYSVVDGNSARLLGGGIHNASLDTFIVNHSTFSGNSADIGGGLYNSPSSTLTVISSTVGGNSAETSGGGIYSSQGTLTITNSIVALNRGGEVEGGPQIHGFNSLIGLDPAFVRNPSDGGDGWGDDPDTPDLDESANDDYGDLRLQPKSFAVDAGDTSRLPADVTDLDSDGDMAEPVPFDLDGNDRVLSEAVDLGPYELQGEPTPGHETLELVVTVATDTVDLYDGQLSLREAIWYAGLKGLGNTITFDAALADATITLDGAPLLIDRSLTIDASTLPSLTISGDSKSRVLQVGLVNEIEVELIGVAITGGNATEGAGIHNYASSTLTVTNSTITSNAASGEGGGIRNSGTLTLVDSMLTANSAAENGGGICNSGTLTMTGSTLQGNSAVSSGGGIHGLEGTLTINGSILRENSATQGGAISIESGTLIATDSVLERNLVDNYGGAVFVQDSGTLIITNSTLDRNASANRGGGVYNRGICSVANTIFSGNSARTKGAGAYNIGGTMTFVNSVFIGNSVNEVGGGIYNSSGTTTVISSTLSGNSANEGGGIYISRGALTVTNSVLSFNDGGQIEGRAVAQTFNNLVDDDPLFVRNPSDGGDGWGDDSTTPDVDEGANDDYGDLRLTVGSPAIHTGDNLLLPEDALDLDGDGDVAEPIPVDLSGRPRVVDDTVDIGAYEFQGAPGGHEAPSLVVSTASDLLNLYDGQISLREAIYYAGRNGLGTEIAFDASLADATITLGGSELKIDKSLTIDASALPSLMIDLSAPPHSTRGAFLVGGADTIEVQLVGLTMVGGDILSVSGSHLTIADSTLSETWISSEGETLTVTGSTLSGRGINNTGGTLAVSGSTFSGNGIYNNGGTLTVSTSTFNGCSDSGIRTQGGKATITNSTFIGNSKGYSRSYGGAVYGLGATITITNSTFIGNSASGSAEAHGGAIYNDQGTLTVMNCTLTGNSAVANENGSGGAIYSTGTLTVIDSTLQGNSATATYRISGAYGGGIYSHEATMTIVNSTLTRNSANGKEIAYGGGVFIDFGTLVVVNSSLAGNSVTSERARGGGIYSYDDSVTLIVNSTLSGNSANGGGSRGGGIYNWGSELTIANSTITGNSAVNDGGGVRGGGTPTVTNSIIALNDGGDFSGTFSEASSNNVIGIDPLFVRNPSDGGDGWADDSTTSNVDERANDDYGDLRLTAEGPAIDAGDNSLLPADEFDLDQDGDSVEPISVDLSGNPRVENGMVDIGAFEFLDVAALHPGDANRDGVTDVRDFMIWNVSKFASGTDWATGDFNGDAVTDVRDFMIWNAHKFTSLPTAPDPVPPDVAEQELDDSPAAIDDLAWLGELEWSRSERSSDSATLAADAVDRLLATYWD